jgi:hypothetical protein
LYSRRKRNERNNLCGIDSDVELGTAVCLAIVSEGKTGDAASKSKQETQIYYLKTNSDEKKKNENISKRKPQNTQSKE